MNRFQVALILGVGLLCTSPVPMLLPQSRTAASSLPEPIIMTAMIGLAGIISLVLAYVFKLKPVPAN